MHNWSAPIDAVMAAATAQFRSDVVLDRGNCASDPGAWACTRSGFPGRRFRRSVVRRAVQRRSPAAVKGNGRLEPPATIPRLLPRIPGCACDPRDPRPHSPHPAAAGMRGSASARNACYCRLRTFSLCDRRGDNGQTASSEDLAACRACRLPQWHFGLRQPRSGIPCTLAGPEPVRRRDRMRVRVHSRHPGP